MKFKPSTNTIVNLAMLGLIGAAIALITSFVKVHDFFVKDTLTYQITSLGERDTNFGRKCYVYAERGFDIQHLGFPIGTKCSRFHVGQLIDLRCESDKEQGWTTCDTPKLD